MVNHTYVLPKEELGAIIMLAKLSKPKHWSLLHEQIARLANISWAQDYPFLIFHTNNLSIIQDEIRNLTHIIQLVAFSYAIHFLSILRQN